MSHQTLLGNFTVVAFILVQFLDGMATYLGLTQFGTSIEANPILRSLMDHYDIVLVLTSAKLFATIAGAVLHLLQFHLLVAALTALYILLAIVPWLEVLSLHCLC
ncbi:MAG: DUF5658 family protein [Acidobacteriota bacterium]